MLTELLCNKAGGPEVVTAEGFDDAKLGVLPEQWAAFMGSSSARRSRSGRARPCSSAASRRSCEEVKPEICIGLVARRARGGRTRKLLREAGYSHVQTTAALLECEATARRRSRCSVGVGAAAARGARRGAAQMPVWPKAATANGDGATAKPLRPR